MPQSSLLGWLNKSTGQTGPPRAKIQADDKMSEEQLPTPPPSSQDGTPAPPSPLLVARNDNATTALKTGSDLQKLTPNVHFRSCQKDDISRLKQINSLLLPIPYPEKFYRETVDDEVINSLTLLATWHDDPTSIDASLEAEKDLGGKLIGAIRCRILTQPPSSSTTTNPASKPERPMLYLSTLVLLSPYRNHGIASHMLDVMAKRAAYEYGVTSIGAHVWEANTEGLDWYRKRGFRELAREEGYYRRLKPPGAIVMQRDIGVSQLLGWRKE